MSKVCINCDKLPCSLRPIPTTRYVWSGMENFRAGNRGPSPGWNLLLALYV